MAFLYVFSRYICGDADNQLELSQCDPTITATELIWVLGEISDRVGNIPAVYMDNGGPKGLSIP